MTDRPPVNALRAPDFLWGYRCNQKGCCCRSWRIGLKEADLHRLRIAAVDTPLADRLDEAVKATRKTAFAAFIPARGSPRRTQPTLSTSAICWRGCPWPWN